LGADPLRKSRNPDAHGPDAAATAEHEDAGVIIVGTPGGAARVGSSEGRLTLVSVEKPIASHVLATLEPDARASDDAEAAIVEEAR
jgi:hypothetical protein